MSVFVGASMRRMGMTQEMQEQAGMEEHPPLPEGSFNGNPAGRSLWKLIKEDYRTHESDLFSQGLWALVTHRFGNWRMSVRSRVLRAPLTLMYRMMFKVMEWMCGISIPYTVPMGRRVHIWHFGGIFIHARRIGDDVQLRHNTTIGVAKTGENLGIPTIGDRVDIGCGACVLGAVEVGHDSVIGANAVVVKDVPAWSVVVGVPGRVVKTLEPPKG